MAMGNYDKILEKVASVSGISVEELQRRVEAKQAKLSGLVTKDGAMQIVAAELGINFDNEKLKIDELLPGMRKVNTVGKVLNLFPVRSFTTKKGEPGKVLNFFLADDTSNIKVVLWDTNHIELFEKGQLKEGSVIEIANGSMRDNEVHLGSFSELKPSEEIFDNVQTEKVVKEKNIIEFALADNVKTRAFVVQSFEPRFFYVCPQCKKKATQEGETFTCAEHGQVVAEKRALMNIVLDDGTETTRTVLFHEALGKIGINALEDPAMLLQQRASLLGKEMVFIGNVRRNSYFNNNEFIIEDAQEVNLDELIVALEK
jgi:ssDNA-binding replication factor A large subunit